MHRRRNKRDNKYVNEDQVQRRRMVVDEEFFVSVNELLERVWACEQNA